MKRLLIVAVAIAALTLLQPAVLSSQAKPQAKPAAPGPVVVLTTLKGVIEIETFPSEAPKSVERFVDLARRGFYRGTRFHWVQPGVVQGGDQYTRDMTKKKLWGTGGSGTGRLQKPIGVSEITARKFERGIVGLAHKDGFGTETADSQFFILRAANPGLNGKYTAIGRVITGMAVVDKIELEDMIKDISVR